MDQAEKFLSLIDPNTNKFLFACFEYRKIKKGRTFFGTFGVLENKLKKLNEEENYCVYVTVNKTEGAERKASAITECRAVWVEDDEPRETYRKDWPLKPSIIVESSPGKYHYYWITKTTNFEEWDKVMQRMVDDHGCDHKARDISRVLRIPGFTHKKDLTKPFVSKLVEGEGTFYHWFQIKTAFPPKEKQKDRKNSDGSVGDYSENKAIQDLLTSRNYHGSLTSIAMSMANKGLSRELQYMTLYGLMNKIPPAKRRDEWEARLSPEHLYECIDSAIAKVEAEEDEGFSIEDTYRNEIFVNDVSMKESHVEFPPGKMGDLCEQIYEMAPYPNKEVALSGGMALIAGIVGRKYNVLGMGLNIYIAILGDSGIGKANLKDSINIALRAGGGNFNIGATFLGRSRYTGPKAVFDMLSNGLSRVSVIEEAGLISESTAGDGAGITRVLLDLFTSSGYGKWAGDEGYSESKNSIPALHSPALSLVNVSTPKSFLKALRSKSADVSGEVARLWMMRSIGKKPYFNRNKRKDYSKDIIAVLGKLITKCHQFQQPEEELIVDDLEVPEKFFDEADRWVDLENKYLEEADHLRRTLCSRAWAKIIKLAAIVSVFNGKIEIGEQEYQWATRAVENELATITDSFTYESSDDMDNVVTSVVIPAIHKMLVGEYKSQKATPNSLLATKGIFTKMHIKQALKNNAVIKDLDDNPQKQNPKTGLDKCLNSMVQSGLLSYLDENKMKAFKSKSKVGFKITADFRHTLKQIAQEKKNVK